MQKTDKIFAGLVILSLCAFWVLLAPAAVTSKISEARTATPEVTTAATSTPSKSETRETSRTITAATERRLTKVEIERLSRRTADTPHYAEENLRDRLAAPIDVPPAGTGVLLDREEPYTPRYQ